MKREQVNRGFWRFFQTEPGRKLVFTGACCTTLGLFLGNYLPHTLGLKYYREFVQCYHNGLEWPVPEKVKQRLQSAIDKLEVSGYERKIIKPFTVFGLDLFQAGSTKYRFGGALGIPVNYAYSSVDDINRNDIRFRDQKIDWNSESGRLLQNAIVLTEEEQIFGISKCILQMQTHRVMLNSVFPSVSFLMVYTIGSFLNTKLNLMAGAPSVSYRIFLGPVASCGAKAIRIVLYSILGLFGVGVWSFLKDFNQVQYDTEIDQKLSNMGEEYVKAGMSFYDKQLQKNIALRHLIGDDTYTAKGNENFFLRQKSLPLTIRKSFFEEKWKEFQKGIEPAANELLQ